MKFPVTHKTLGVAALILSFVFLLLGSRLTHKIYEEDTDGFGIMAFIRISERQLVEDATFSGVIRQEGKLFSTYDRMQPRGKKACPT